MLVLKLGWGATFYIPEAMLPYVPMMIPIKECGKQYKRDEQDVSIVLTDKKIVEGEERVKVEEEAAREELPRVKQYWMDERAKVEKLEAELKALRPA